MVPEPKPLGTHYPTNIISIPPLYAAFRHNMLKLLFFYYKETHKVNIPFSLMAGVIGGSVSENTVGGFVSSFSFCLLTGGLFLSAYFYHLNYKNQYYLYYNRGITKIHLLIFCLTSNLLLILILKTSLASFI